MKKIVLLILSIVLLYSCNQGTKDNIKLGATFPLTGDVASYGIHAKNGIQLKIDEINESGGINGKQIIIDFQDDKNLIKDAVNIFNDFAAIKKYPIVFGSAGSSVSLSLVPLANRYEIVLISPISSSSELSTKGGDFFFRTVPSDNLQAEMLAKTVTDDNIKKVAIVYTNNSWGKPLSDGFKMAYESMGGEVVFEEGVQENTSDFRTIILKLKKLDIDAIVSPTYPKEGGLFLKQLKEAGIEVRLYGGDNWGAPEFVEIAQNAAEGAIFTFPSESKSPTFDKFTENYKQKFNEDPDIIAAYGYDAATAIVLALKKCTDLTSEEIRKQLLEVSFQGVSDMISFKPNGDIVSEGYGKRIIKDSESIILE